MPTESAGVFTIFGLNGDGHVPFKPELPLDSIKDDWDAYHVDFKRAAFANGIRHHYIINEHLYLNTMIGNVKNKNMTEMYRLNPYLDYKRSEYHTARYNRNDYKLNSYLNIKLNKKHNLRFGTNLTWYTYDYRYLKEYTHEIIAPLTPHDTSFLFMNRKGTSNIVQFFGQYKLKFSDNLSMNLGVNALYFDLTKSSSIDPRLSLKYKQNDRSKWILAAGRHSKNEDLSILFMRRDGKENYMDLDLVKSNHLIFGNEYKLNEDWYLKSEIYFQHMYDVGVENQNNYAFSNFNMFEFYSLYTHDSIVDMSSEGKAKSRGIEVSIEKYFNNQYYFLVNASFSRSFFTDIDGNWYPSVFDHKHIFKIATGKEWSLGKNDEKTLGINIRLRYAQGKRFLEVDEEASIARKLQTYNYEAGYLQVGPAIKNMDFGFNYIVNRKKVTHEIRLDLYNATDAIIPMGTYFDRVQNKKVAYNFQDMMPFFNYSVKW